MTTEVVEDRSPGVEIATPSGIPSTVVARSAFDELNRTLERWFYKPDLQAIRIVLGTIQAHYLCLGDPAWLFVVAPPGAGKTAMSMMTTARLKEVLSLGDITENSFLSGFYEHPTPGILEKLGRTRHIGGTFLTTGDAILMAKDFTTVLSMRREKRAAILSQLREMHDGEFNRAFGTGQTKIWRGRVTVIAAVTPALDRHYSIFSTLGERFLQVRWHRPDSPEAGERAIAQQGRENEIRHEVRRAIHEIFNNASPTRPVLDTASTKRVADFAEIIALARTHVYREGFGNREIEYVPESEANTRISKGLASIAQGVASLNRHPSVSEDDLQDAFRVGLDSLTELRRQILVSAITGQQVSGAVASKTARNRAVEELQELGVLDTSNPLQLTPRVQALLTSATVKL